ncbi:MAG TPA: hypothetical protein VMW83_02200 [Spirochaetia bacterium]|nr:hypothetical protein [Spirochaetia bacterium]
MLTRLFGRTGMVVRFTDDPEIKEHPANVLMARIGANVPTPDILAFEDMLFDWRDPY